MLTGILLAAGLGPAPAWAQDSALTREVQRLQRDLDDLQRYVYNNRAASGGADSQSGAAAVPGDFGSSDSVARMQVELQTMQGQMRDLTGRIEQIEYGVRSVGERLDKLVADIDLRLQALEGGPAQTSQAPGAMQQGRPGLPSPEKQASGQENRDGAQAEASGSGLQPGQKVLGSLSDEDLKKFGSAATPAPSAAPGQPSAADKNAAAANKTQTAALPEGSVREQYDHAFSLLKQRNFGGAEAAWKAFVARHPEHDLAANGFYWLGETYYIQGNYAEAARVFLDGFQRFPKSNKAPDNLFKLGKSLAAVGEKEPACASFRKLVDAYPQANSRVISSAKSEIGQLGCS